MDYQLYLRSPEWLVKREERLRVDDYKCVRCGQEGFLEVHHLTYVRLGRELVEDLQTLCNDCHRVRHDIGPSSNFEGFRRDQKQYRKTFLEYYGPFPHMCYFGDGEVDGHTKPCDSTATVIHHIDEDRTNNDPSNLAAAHWGCHTRHHATGRTLSPTAREKIGEAKREWWQTAPEEARKQVAQNWASQWYGPMLNKQHGPVARAKMRQALLARNATEEGRKKTLDALAKAHQALRDHYAEHDGHTEDAKRKMSEANLIRPVLICDLCGKEIRGGKGNLAQHRGSLQCVPPV